MFLDSRKGSPFQAEIDRQIRACEEEKREREEQEKNAPQDPLWDISRRQISKDGVELGEFPRPMGCTPPPDDKSKG